MSQSRFIKAPIFENENSLKESRYGTSCIECRERKVKCVPLKSSSRCLACSKRETRCSKQEHFHLERAPTGRTNLGRRLKRLELLVQSLEDQRTLQSAVDTPATTPNVQQRGLSSEEKLFSASHGGKPAPVFSFANSMCSRIGEDYSLSLEDESGLLRDYDTFRNSLAGKPAVHSILSPTGSFKHEKDCKALLTAVRSHLNLCEALEEYRHAWDLHMRTTQPSASAAERDIKEYAVRAFHGDDPTKIAKIVQVVAMATKDTVAFENLVSLIDRLILHDDGYLNTLEGLECAIEQARLLIQLGLPRRAWLTIRNVISHAALMGIHRTQVGPREDWIWRVAFQMDRYVSLLINSPYSITDAHCNIISYSGAPDPGANTWESMTRLAILVGKVVDHRQNFDELTYSSTMEIDTELNSFASQTPTEPWELYLSAEQESRFPLIKTVERAIGHFILLQAKLLLHFPWMLKSTADPDLEHSRTTCVMAARGILRLFQEHRRLQLIEAADPHKTTPADFIGFTAAATLIICQAGYGPLWEDPTQLQEDQKLVYSTNEIYRNTKSKTGHQISSILQKMNRMREGHEGNDGAPNKLSIPFLGEVLFPGKEKSTTEVHYEIPSSISTSPMASYCYEGYSQSIPMSGFTQHSIYMPNAFVGNNL